MQNKTTMRFHLTPIKMAAIKKKQQPGKVVHAYNPSYSEGRRSGG
jgi:hypothetical protein